jgi:hypothetical protein
LCQVGGSQKFMVTASQCKGSLAKAFEVAKTLALEISGVTLTMEREAMVACRKELLELVV